MTNFHMAQKALTEACREIGLQTDVQVVDIQQGTRWVIAYDQDPKFPRFDYAMIRLEKILREVTRSPIELMGESEADKNRRDKKHGRVVKTFSGRGIESLES